MVRPDCGRCGHSHVPVPNRGRRTAYFWIDWSKSMANFFDSKQTFSQRLQELNLARFGLIAGYSAVAASAALMSATWDLIARLSVAPWFGRVPTVCIPADVPSRCRPLL